MTPALITVSLFIPINFLNAQLAWPTFGNAGMLVCNPAVHYNSIKAMLKVLGSRLGHLVQLPVLPAVPLGDPLQVCLGAL